MGVNQSREYYEKSEYRKELLHPVDEMKEETTSQAKIKISTTKQKDRKERSTRKEGGRSIEVFLSVDDAPH